MGSKRYPVTPDGKYFVVRGQLWRCSNPRLPPEEKRILQSRLMEARRKLRRSYLDAHPDEETTWRQVAHECKVALGERGPVWWNDGAPDYNRKKVENTPYADWYSNRIS